MIGKLNHIAIATPKLDEAVKTYKNMLGVKISSPIDQIDHGVKVVFIELPNTKIELLEPLGEKSPIENFLEKNLYNDQPPRKNIALAKKKGVFKYPVLPAINLS